MYLKAMIDSCKACRPSERDEVIDFLKANPTELKLLSNLFSEDVGDFVRTIRSLVWQIAHARKAKTFCPGGFVLHRQGRISMYFMKIKKAR